LPGALAGRQIFVGLKAPIGAERTKSTMHTTKGLVLTALVALLSASAQGQYKVSGSPSAADYAAVAAATSTSIHIMYATTAAGLAAKDSAASTSGIPPTVLLPPGGKRYPDDLSYQGGPTIGTAAFHAIYVDNPFVGCDGGSCWGNPETFLTNLGHSEFIHVTDQYVGRSDNNRYTDRASLGVVYVSGGQLFNLLGYTFTDADMQALVHFVVTYSPANFPSGENQIYHIFLPPGTDECFTSAKNVCYSPDNPATFYYCGYHSSVTFADIGHVVYTVEPYTNVRGCSVPPGTPNGSLTDSTANTLSHETFETITDPEGTAWWNAYNIGSRGEEIGDECSYVAFTSTGAYYNPSVFSINGKNYAVQEEYSNSQHACSNSTDEDDE
jgi:hypothetical protein